MMQTAKNKLLSIFEKAKEALVYGIVYAQPDIEIDRGNQTNISDLSSLINLVINTIFVVGLAASLIFIIIGGIKYITSQGDEQKATEARDTITNAVLGAVVIVGFRVILDIVLNLIGADGLDTLLQN